MDISEFVQLGEKKHVTQMGGLAVWGVVNSLPQKKRVAGCC